MYIAAATISMDAARTYKEVEQRFTGASMGSSPAAGQSDPFGLRLASLLATTTQTSLACRSEVGGIDGSAGPLREAAGNNATIGATLAQLTEQVIGRPVSVGAVDSRGILAGPLAPTEQVAMTPIGVQTASLISGVVYSQEESLLFSAQGTVQTSDGRTICFDLGLSIQRCTTAITVGALEVSTLFIDPLILQFDVNAPLLGDSTFLFDLDGDGTLERIACPGSGCGFLALDRDGDGRITTGLELFGPGSGSGFGELAELDSDANLWIDANDPLFDQLLIWTPDSGGGERLQTLREAGVGAIAVMHAGTTFELQRPDGSVLGRIRASGLFLTEDGEVRPMHEVDLAVPESGAASSATGDGDQPAAGRLDTAFFALRTLISMQRLRLQLLLAGQRMRGVLNQGNDHRQLLFNWLQAHQEWQARLEAGRAAEGGWRDGTPQPANHPTEPATEV